MALQSNVVAVLDNNVLRNEGEILLRLERFQTFGEQLALPEIALFEMTKHPDAWEETTRRSLRHISACPEALVLTHSAKTMRITEERSGDPVQSVIAADKTLWIRAVLRDLKNGGGESLTEFIGSVHAFRDELDHEGHANDCQAVMQKLTGLATPSLATDILAEIGKQLADGDRRILRELLVAALPLAAHRDALVRRGIPPAIATRLTDQPSVSALYAMALGAIALEWTVRRGIESARAGRVGNDVTDIEYAIAALWTGDLLSEDRRARERYQDLQTLGAAAWPDAAAWFGRGQALAPKSRT